MGLQRTKDLVLNAEVADDALETVKFPAVLDVGTTDENANILIDKALVVTHVSFHNVGATALNAAATVKRYHDTTESTIATSTATLAGDAVEEKEGGDLSNADLADGDQLRLYTGTVAADSTILQVTVTCTKKLNI
ncbi:unnamed protein product [marine sediment metagenome]|uniref:Uncharacterized protein n=1 Tax=marine sediment metagenome TaxID=412755 RepID=X1SPK2_9ZZZZ